jgi:hypothetical protein
MNDPILADGINIVNSLFKNLLGKEAIHRMSEAKRLAPIKITTESLPCFEPDYIEKVILLYSEGMPTADIAACVGLPDTEVDKIIDSIAPYL